ncbi:hypothetical protein ACROYT_G005732 [Oculina patagonica]
MSCDEKNNKRRKKRSKQSSETNSHIPKSVENREVKAELSPKAGTPYIDSEQCLLCHKERYERSKKGELLKSMTQGSSSNGSSVSQAPLWVCPDCRRNIEEEERRAAMEPSIPDQDLMQKPSLNLTLSITTKPCEQLAKCSCQSCERSSVKQDIITDVAKEKERQQLRCCWSEVRNIVRCIYREAGTSLADEEETVKNSLDENRLKVKVEKLQKSDPAQLFEKLETQAREYVREVKVRLVKYLTSCPLSPNHAKEFFTMLLDEYQALSKAFDILRPFFSKLDFDHLREFGLSWDLLHKHLFYTEIYRDPAVYGNLPGLITQLRLGAVSRENFHQDTFPNLLHRYLNFTDDLTEIEFSWKESERAFKLYKEKQAKLREKSGIPKVEWEDDTTGVEWKNKVLKNPVQQKCLCGHCNVPTSPLNSPLSMLPPFKTASSHTKVCNHASAAPTQNTAGKAQWTNPVAVPNFNPHLLVCNDLHGIPPPSQLLPPPLMMNGLGSPCHCPACSGTTGYRDGAKNAEQPPSGKMADCQCSKCPFHGAKDQETRLKAENKNCTAHSSPAVHAPPPNNNHIHSNHLHPHHIIPPPPTSLHCSLEGAPPDLHGFLLDSSLRHVNYNGYHNNLDGCTEIDDDENSLSDSNSDYDDEDDEDDEDDDDDDGSSCSPRRTSQSSDIDGLGLDVPPGSPSSVRSSGDGSSCDTPPVNQCSSSTEDGRTDRGKYCDCCYCEFFGHAAPPVAPTSHNYTEMRDKLRLRLNKRQPNQPVQEEKKEKSANVPVVDHRSVDDLLTFINGQKMEEERLRTNSKAQKRARQKQKKAAEKAKQIPSSSTQRNDKGVPTPSSGCDKVNGVHQNGTGDVLRNRQLSEERRKPNEISANNVKERENGKTGHRRKAEEQKQKQAEAPNEGCKSRKKQNYAIQDVTVSRQGSRVECNGKENNFVPRRKSEEKSEKKRQESVSSEPPAPVCSIKDEVQDKTDNNSRLPQKKQGKKKKKISLDDVFLPREDIETEKLTQMDEAERELEEFKRFCMNLTPVERRERIPVNVNLKGLLSGKKNGSS